MFVGLGTLINVVAIVFGTLLGLVIGRKFSEKVRELVTQAMGMITLIAAADALSRFWEDDFQNAFSDGIPILIILFSLALGAIIGSALGIEERISAFGERLKQRFSRGDNPRFVEGFLAASVLFVVGPMAILGSISDGMGEGIELLVLKSTLDFFITIAFTASFGWSVGLSIIPVALYQLSWTLVGFGLGEILDENQVTALTVVGGTLLVGISLYTLGIKRIAIGNLLPALAIAPIVVGLLS
ncbi:MAG: DUF554 domain-containing protein [Actinomycetota bacterium]